MALEWEIDGHSYPLLMVEPGRYDIGEREVPTQPGEGDKPRHFPIKFHGGFGASRRHSDGSSSQALNHHDFAVNWDSRYDALGLAAPRITFLDLSVNSKRSLGFQFGGTKRGQLGGGSGFTSFGGGTKVAHPQSIKQYGEHLYISGGTRTWTVDIHASTPALVETHEHGNSADAGSSEVFGNELGVALGSYANAEWAISPASDNFSTQWQIATDVKMAVYRAAKNGRLFSSRLNRVFNVLNGADPKALVNYLPTVGEVVTDEADPVRSLEDYSRGLVAGTGRSAYTFDPNAGFIARPLLPLNRLSTSKYDGRAMLAEGWMLLYATTRAVWLFRGGQRPIKAGPEQMTTNESPYIGGEPGKPTFAGDWIYWPYYYPNSGDSVIWAVRERLPGEPGVGPLVWIDFLHMAGRQCRVAYFWGGSETHDHPHARLVFGAGTVANPQQVGWCDLGHGGGPDPFDTDAVPALSATIYGAADDLGTPTTIKQIERVELPDISDASVTNYLVISASIDHGTEWVELVQGNHGESFDERIIKNGYGEVFPPVARPIEGRAPKLRFAITQAAAATTFLKLRGYPILVVNERPAMTTQRTITLDIEPGTTEDAEERLTRLRALAPGATVPVKRDPRFEAVDFWARVSDVQVVPVAIRDDQGQRHNRHAVNITLRTVPVQVAS